MFEWLKKPLFATKKEKKIERQKVIDSLTIDEVPDYIYNELEKLFYGSFQFVKLYQPLETDGIIGKFMPYINAALIFLTLIVLIIKK